MSERVAASYSNPILPLLNLVISVIGLLDMACRALEQSQPQEISIHTSLHHNLRRRAVDILLEAYVSSVRVRSYLQSASYRPTT